MTGVDWDKITVDMHMACLRRNVSQRDIAIAIGVGPSTLSRLRHGKRLSADAVAALVAWLYPDEPKPCWITDGVTTDPAPDPRIDMEAT